jgi:hypothetical protein
MSEDHQKNCLSEENRKALQEIHDIVVAYGSELISYGSEHSKDGPGFLGVAYVPAGEKGSGQSILKTTKEARPTRREAVAEIRSLVHNAVKLMESWENYLNRSR